MKRPEVSIKKVKDIKDLDPVKNAVEKSLYAIGGLGYGLRNKDKVLIKPNVLMPMDYRTGAVTNPLVIEAVIILLQDFGIKNITIGEGSVVGESSMRSMKACGLDKLAERTGVDILDLKKDKFIPMSITDGKIFRILKIPLTVAEADAVINIPVLKTHDMFPVSLGLKNIKGIIHENDKQRFHAMDLAQCIVDLNKLALPRLTIIDGTIGMEGLGPVYGIPADMKVIISSYDALAADTVGSLAMGIKPSETRYLKLASEQGLGTIEIKEIDVLGESINDIKKDFKRVTLEDVLAEKGFKDCNINITDRGACSGCRAVITSLISDAQKRGKASKLKDTTFIMGQNASEKDISDDSNRLVFLGNCTKKIRTDRGIYMIGCPPHILNVKKKLDYKVEDFDNFDFMKTHLQEFGFKEE